MRWSDPEAVTLDGDRITPTRLSVNYQSIGDGGCTNTDARVDGVGVVQWTNAGRTTPQGAVIAVPSGPPPSGQLPFGPEPSGPGPT